MRGALRGTRVRRRVEVKRVVVMCVQDKNGALLPLVGYGVFFSSISIQEGCGLEQHKYGKMNKRIE